MILFHGYSDDVVIIRNSSGYVDEFYSTYYLLSDGSTVTAFHGQWGWEFTCDNPNHFIIPAADPDDCGINHTDPRIPKWADPDGYSPVLIINADDVTIVTCSDDPIPKNIPSKVYKLIDVFADLGICDKEDVDATELAEKLKERDLL